MGENTAKQPSFFKSLKKEFKKILWPDGRTLIKQTFTVITISLIVGAIVALIDFLYSTGFSLLLGN